MGVLAPLLGVTGTPSYVRLRFQLAAIEIAEEGLSQFDESNAENDRKTSPVEVIAGILEEEEALKDHFLCAAYIEGQWKPLTQAERNIRELSIHDYNDIANAMDERIALSKKQFLNSASQTSQNSILADAQATAAADRKVKAAQVSLIDAVGGSLLLAIDLSDTTAKTLKYMTLTCNERDEILRISKSASEAGDSDYQKTAGIIFRKVSEFGCRD